MTAEIKKGKILLIEDDITLLEMYKMKFREEGYEVDASPRGAEGLDLAQKNKYDIILLDIILPEIDGLAILKELKEKASTKNTPVILLSNLGQDTDIKRGQELGAAYYLVKANFTPSQVVSKVEEIFKQYKK